MLGGVRISASRLEEHEEAKNSIVVITKDGAQGGFEVGRVRRFLRVCRYEWEDSEHEALLADVDWYTAAAKGRPAIAQLDGAGLVKHVGLPVVKRRHVDDPMGNFWRCDQLLQCKFGLVPHPLRELDMTLVSRPADMCSMQPPSMELE